MFGNNTLNRIAPKSFGESFNIVEIHLGGSGAVDNLVYTRRVPEPGGLALVALGMVILGGPRRTRRGAADQESSP